MKNNRIYVYLLVSMLLLNYVMVFVPSGGGDSQVWENQYGRLEVYPRTATDICRQVQYADLDWYWGDSVIDVVFRFDEQISDAGIWIWENIGHLVRVPDYGWIQDTYTLVSISDFSLIDEPDFVMLGDIPSDNYAIGDASYWSNFEWWNNTFTIGFDSFDWLNPEHTSAVFYYEYWGVTGYHWEEQYWYDWKDITDSFSYSYGYGMHNYYVTDWNVKQDHNYSFKWQYSVHVNSVGKWILMAKLSSETIPEALASDHYIEIDPYWDSSWGYYKTLDIDNKIEDYQMKLIVEYDDGLDASANVSLEGNGGQVDFDDLRFVYDNTTELPYWIENVTDSISCNVWVNNSGNYSSFEMFYGNDAASTTSNGTNTFYAWDDFDDGYSIDDTPKAGRGWTTSGIGASNYFMIAANPSGSGNVLKCAESGDGTLTTLKLLSFGVAGEYSIHYKTYATGHAGHYFFEECREGGEAGTYCAWAGISNIDGSVQWYGPPESPGVKEFAPELDLGINSWEDSELRITSTTYHYVLDGADGAGDFYFDPAVGIDTTIFYHNENTAGTFYIDDFYIRKYNITEPSWSAFGSEIQQPYAPYMNTPVPVNGSTDIGITPGLNINVYDNNTETIDIRILSNSEGNWDLIYEEDNVVSGSTVTHTEANFSSYITTYYWAVNITDGTYSVEDVFHFTTTSETDAPVLSNENPGNETTAVSVDIDISITIEDPDGDRFNYSIECSDGSGVSVNEVYNGTKILVLDGDLVQCINYTWWVNATDGNKTVNGSYNFIAFCPTDPADGYQLAWNETITQLCVDLVDDEGDGMEYEIRQDGVVLESGGTLVYNNYTLNFTDSINNSVHWESGKSSMSSGIALTDTTEFTGEEYQNISWVNESGVNTDECSPSIWSHHNFSFDLSDYEVHNITGLQIYWRGYGGYYTGGAKPKWNWGVTMYFDTDGTGWYTATSTTPYTTDDYTPNEEGLNYSAHHDMADWIDDDGFLNVAVEHTSALDCSVIYTDYIELVVTTIGGGVGNGTYCASDVSWWDDTCGVEWSWVVYVNDDRGDTSTTTYTFTNTPCTFSGTVYPLTGAADVCPCCDAICIDVTAGYRFNMTVYGREHGSEHWYVWNSYTDISPSEYCFCMDGIMPTTKIHATVHSHTIHTVDIINRWYNVTFEHYDSEDMTVVPATGTVIIPSYGHYTASFWAGVTDDSPVPIGHNMAIRIIQNDTDQVDGSYRETTFNVKEGQKHLSGDIHAVFYPSTTLRFQYIGSDTDQKINITDTWSDDNICFYAYIEKTSPIEESNPMQYNTTYEWYVNVSKFDNSSLYNETIVYSFTTASDYEDCVVVGGGGGIGVSGVSGVIGLIGIFGIFGWFIHRRRKEN